MEGVILQPRQRSKVAVIIPAAGAGTRMGGARKQFRMLGGKPLLVQTILLFEKHPEVDFVVIAVPELEVQRIKNLLGDEDISKLCAVLPGGASRQQSVHAGLKAVPPEADIIMVHDGVRPFVSREAISELIASIEEKGAGALAIPVADTLRYGREGRFGRTTSRDELYRMQTPQGCKRAWFLDAATQAIRSGYDATDDVDLFQRAGYDVSIVDGSSLNFKITTRADWDLACIIWPDWERSER